MSDKLKAAIADLEKAPKVNIKGKNYSQVSNRVEIFRKHFGHDYGIMTRPLDAPDPLVRVEAVIFKGTIEYVIATGLAEEDRTKGNINKTSALENCETSAIGRALANFGLHGGEYASAGEVENAIAQQQGKTEPPPLDKPMPEAWPTATKLKAAARALSTDIIDSTDEEMLNGVILSNAALIKAIKENLPEWWAGKPGTDRHGLSGQVESKRAEFRDKQLGGMLVP